MLTFLLSISLLLYPIRSLTLIKAVKSGRCKSYYYHSYYDVSNTLKEMRCCFETANETSSSKQKLREKMIKKSNTVAVEFRPFISVLVATHNEKMVVNRLIRSLKSLTYPPDKFKIIIVDDSNDGTYDLLRSWTSPLSNLKVIHREHRVGWKGGALNIALENLHEKSQYVLVADADIYFIHDTLEKFALFLTRSLSMGLRLSVIQGYPISVTFPKYCQHNYDSYDYYQPFTKDISANWVARGISFRLAHRNTIEFFGKSC
jgi:cellulose synthase/poly-beta-1,6-N-acetylglucosamine synthase-like glycosyltransferase